MTEASADDQTPGNSDPPAPSADTPFGRSLGPALRDAFVDVLEEPVPPALVLLAAELERRLSADGPADPAARRADGEV